MTWTLAPECVTCKRWIGSKEGRWGLFCEAFPDGNGIPERILEGLKHHEPIEGDHGLQYEFDPDWEVKRANFQ